MYAGDQLEYLGMYVAVCTSLLGLVSLAGILGLLASMRITSQHNERVVKGLLEEMRLARETIERVCEKSIDPGVLHQHCAERREGQTRPLHTEVKMWSPPPEAYEPPEEPQAGEMDEFRVSRG